MSELSPFGATYCKINTLWKRDQRGVIIPGEYSDEEVEYLKDLNWRWTEKVDGTNIRLHWNGEKVVIGGRTDRAQIPADLIEALRPYTENTVMWNNTFSTSSDVTIYGEGYGPGIQKGGGLYSDVKSFAAFDIRVGGWWLKPYDVELICYQMGIYMVPFYGIGPVGAMWGRLITDGLKSERWPDHPIEGIVGVPQLGLADRAGRRVIVKMKVKDWDDYQKANS